jgi:hypothetical protein
MDLFWIYEEKVIFDCLIHVLELQKEIIMKMDMGEVVRYIRDNMMIDCITTYGLQKSLPF